MAVDAGTIKSEIRIDIKKLEQDIGKVKSKFSSLAGDVKKPTDRIAKAFTGATDSVKGAFARLSGSVKKSSDKIKNTFNNLSNSVKISAGIAFAAVGALAKASIGQFAEFEQSMANVQSVARGTPAEFKKLEDAALKAGETTRYSASQAAEALYSLASAGLNATDATNALEGALSLAAATGSDLATASAAIATTLSQYGLEATEAGSITNVFAAAIANSLATLPKLQASLAKVGPLAGKLGVSLEETTGALQALYNGGIRGEEAGTALKNILSSLANEADPAAQKLAELGISFEDVDPAANSLADVIGVLEEANLSAGQAFEIFGKEAGTPLLTILAGGKKGFEELTAAVTGTNAASEATAIQNATLKGLFDKLNSAVQSLQIKIVNALNPALQGIIRFIKNIVDWISKAHPLVLGLGTAAITTAAGVGGLTLAMRALGLATSVSLGPITVIAGILGAVGGGIATATANTRKLKIENLAKEFSGIGAAAGLTGEQINSAREAFEKALLQIKKINGVNTVVRASNEKLAASIESIAETLGKTTDETLALIDVEKDRHDEIRESIRLNKEFEKIIQAISDAENEAGISTQTEEAIQKQKELKETLSDRAKAEQEAADAIAVLQTQSNDGYIKQEEFIQRTIDANNALIETLYALGASKEGGGADDETLRATIAQNEALLEGIRIEERDRVEKEAKKDTLKEVAKVTADYNQKLENLGATNEELVEVARRTALAQVEGHDAATDAVNKYYDALVNEDKIEEAKEQAEVFQESLKELFFSGAESIGSIAGSIADIQIAENDRVLQSQLEAQGLEEETKIQKLAREVKAAEKAAKKEKDVKKKENLLQLAEEKKKELARAKLIQETEKKNAQVRYKAALAQWAIQATTAAATSAQAILTAIASAPPPLNIPAIAATTLAAGAQVFAIGAAVPQPPAFQTGGIVLPSDGGRTVRVAENGHPETLFNSGPEGQAFIRQMAGYIVEETRKGQSTGRRQTPIEIRIPVIINEETVAEVIAPIVVDAVNNGLLELEK